MPSSESGLSSCFYSYYNYLEKASTHLSPYSRFSFLGQLDALLSMYKDKMQCFNPFGKFIDSIQWNLKPVCYSSYLLFGWVCSAECFQAGVARLRDGCHRSLAVSSHTICIKK